MKTSRERLIKKYECILDDEEFSDEEHGISIPLIIGVLGALKEGMDAAHFELERDINEQHMSREHFRRVRWAWNRAIKAVKYDARNAHMS